MNLQHTSSAEPSGAPLAVIGLGYVGLPLALAFERSGAAVTGFDVAAAKVEALVAGQSPIATVKPADVHAALQSKRLRFTANEADLAGVRDFILCVPTPLDSAKQPDLTAVRSATALVGRHLRAGGLVALESTVYPGATREVVVPILESGSGLRAGIDFHVAFSPEREDPGNAQFEAASIPKLVGGLTEACAKRALALYGSAIRSVVEVPSLETAEMAKLLENVFRAVNIALVNELKLICHRISQGNFEVDVFDVIRAASTKPFGYMPFWPGPGLGGHCIPVDPHYLAWKAREFDVSCRLIETAADINWAIPRYVVQRTVEALSSGAERPVKGARVLLAGVSYKADVDDTRESPAHPIAAELLRLGADVSFTDPHVAEFRVHDRPDEALPRVDLVGAPLPRFDAVVILAAHRRFDLSRLLAVAPVVVDTRRVVDPKDFDGIIVQA